MTARLLAAIILLLGAILPVQAERLVATLSRGEIAITSSFSGETLTFFGNVEPDTGSPNRFVEGPFHVIIAVTGPLQNRVARRKTNNLGIWINTEQAEFRNLPSFYHVMTSAKLSDITNPITLAELGIPLEVQAQRAAVSGWWDTLAFSRELVRLMVEDGQFGMNEQGVQFRSNTFYSAQVTLPSNTPPGRYIAHTYLFKNGVQIGDRAEDFIVRKVGFERFLGLAAIQQPLLYGLVCVVLAVFTGWLGGVVFRR